MAIAVPQESGLARVRHELGLSQCEASRVTGISRRQLARLEERPAITEASLRAALTYVALGVLVGGWSNEKEA
jgi:predicted transcriptional regulator